ncbi:rCG54882 [Rattus norvegicus]|uniref:RCG54882 n=1 Tax=Rattus norvegicus TaxID=10116 RepID=A6IIJ1_RAT|nr:rCG54882 [Rattus norvegicus]
MNKKHRLLSLIFKALRTCFLPRDFRCIFILHGFPVSNVEGHTKMGLTSSAHDALYWYAV